MKIEIEVCDICQSPFNLVDICGENKVLCHSCLKRQHNFADFQISFSGDLNGFGLLVNMLKGLNNGVQAHV